MYESTQEEIITLVSSYFSYSSLVTSLTTLQFELGNQEFKLKFVELCQKLEERNLIGRIEKRNNMIFLIVSKYPPRKQRKWLSKSWTPRLLFCITVIFVLIDGYYRTLGVNSLSMIGDKIFNFKKTILESGLFPELKRQFGDLDNFLADNGEQIDKVARSIGEALGKAVAGTANVMKVLARNSDLLLLTLKTLIALKIAQVFYGLTTAINVTSIAMLRLNTITKKNLLISLHYHIPHMLAFGQNFKVCYPKDYIFRIIGGAVSRYRFHHHEIIIVSVFVNCLCRAIPRFKIQ